MQPPREPFTPEFKALYDEVYLITWLYGQDMIGFKESRTLLEGLIDGFSKVRDHELDEYVTLAEQAQNEDKTLTDEPPEPPSG